jgi:PTH1 family peptidyl-tRNA hydrolase
MAIRLIVGLGNPGPEYEHTRHNAGQLFVEKLASVERITLERSDRFHGRQARMQFAGEDVRLLIPTTYMNNSGRAVGAMAQFYKIEPPEILVAYDEVAFAPGIARIKKGGGLNGHNGLRDIVAALGNRDDFVRLRVGVGHPGDKQQVVAYLTGRRMPAEERKLLDATFERALAVLPTLVKGDINAAMTALHTDAA